MFSNIKLQTIIYSILGALIIGIAGFAIKKYNEIAELEQKLEDCLEVPKIELALFRVSEYVGARRRIYFKTECRHTRDFNDYYDNDNTCGFTFLNVTDDQSFSINKEDYEGTLTGSKYIVEWVDYWSFYFDLSEEGLWNVNSLSKTIEFNAPEIQFFRSTKNGEFLAYNVDKAIFSNDSRSLLKMTKATRALAEQKAKEYLKQAEFEIRTEMEESIQEFMKDFLTTFGYPEYQIKVIW